MGMMGSGKTTVGRALADRLCWDLVDSDAQVEARTGMTVTDIWQAGGEAAFRRLESEALAEALGPGRMGLAVVAAGGGAVLSEANRRLLREGARVAWLRARPSTLAARLGDGPGPRPLLDDDPAASLARLDGERRDLYAEVADVVVDVDGLAPADVVEAVVAALAALERAGQR